ncbi:MAG TPA: phospho-N-acetylmuramoyl-pentapeptide-transferase [Acidimicrobiales bacterium]|nr:phospho-N-acetylmuramoyl-pentapeptide-transferase [Acidimicrobiales bacterium]
MVALLLAAALAMFTSLVGTRFLIQWLIARRVGQPIHEDVPEGHTVKAGTPTMGGVAIVVACIVGYLAAHVRSGLVFTRTGVLVLACITGAGIVGLLDDWIKVSNERNLGLSKGAKTAGLLVVAVGFSVAAVLWTDVETTLSFTRWNTPGWELGDVGWCLWAILLIYATTNGVNLSDGLDGLAAGSAIFVFSCLTVIGFWALRHFDVYQINHALDLAVVAAAMVGACAGFLWWNAAPARIFMGDTGSLAIGAGLAALVLTLNVQLLLPIFGALYVAESLSVILQVGSFRLFKRRILRMAPIHHHFELGGWPETTVIIRFWLLAGAAAALGLGLFYADFIGTGGLD